MRRAQDRKAVRLAAVDQLAQDEAGFDRFADTDIVGDQESYDIEPERHQERHQLVSTGLETESSRGTKRPCTTPKRQPQRLGEKPGAVLGRGLVAGRQLES